MKLEFFEDVFYNGKLQYTKGVHEVSTELGWADRWIRRGAVPVDTDLTGVQNTLVEVEEKTHNTRKRKYKNNSDLL